MELILPHRINAGHLIPFLSLLDKARNESEIIINFAELRRVSPAGLVSLTARARRWVHEGRKVTFRNLRKCPISGYLQRMDLFKACGVAVEEKFERHDAVGRFVPVRRIEVDVEAMGSEMALC